MIKTMRSKLLFIVFVSLILGSCTKDTTKINPKNIEIPAALIAKWNWIYSAGGLGGFTYTPQSTGEIRTIEFDANYNYKYYVNDILNTECKFYIENMISITNHDSVPTLTVKGWLGRQSIWFHSSDTLILFEEYFDGFEHHYTRVK
jgi:hypothetical protein